MFTLFIASLVLQGSIMIYPARARMNILERDGRAVYLRGLGLNPPVLDEPRTTCAGICDTLVLNATNALLTRAGDCDQQDVADQLIDVARNQTDSGITNKLIALAVEYREAERNTPADDTVTPPVSRNSVYCQKAPRNPELKGLVQSQDSRNDINAFFDPAQPDKTVSLGEQANTFHFDTVDDSCDSPPDPQDPAEGDENGGGDNSDDGNGENGGDQEGGADCDDDDNDNGGGNDNSGDDDEQQPGNGQDDDGCDDEGDSGRDGAGSMITTAKQPASASGYYRTGSTIPPTPTPTLTRPAEASATSSADPTSAPPAPSQKQPLPVALPSTSIATLAPSSTAAKPASSSAEPTQTATLTTTANPTPTASAPPFLLANGKLAQAKNAEVSKQPLKNGDPCSGNEVACLGGNISLGACTQGKFKEFPCPGQSCYAVPLRAGPGISSTCINERDAVGLIAASGAGNSLTPQT